MESDLTCFSSTLISSDNWEENLLQCRALIAQQESAEIWTMLSNDVESFRDKLVEWMDQYPQAQPRAWMTAKTYCDLTNLPGSEAYRACDRKSVRSLLLLMRRAAESEMNDEAGEGGRKKRRKSGPSEDDKRDWDLLFSTVSRMSDYVDMEELSDFFISVGLRMNSVEALHWVETLSHVEKKRIALLKTLLHESLKLVTTNELLKETTTWIQAALQALTKDNEDHLLAFCQRLVARVESATQATRSKLVEFITSCVTSASTRDRFAIYCGQNLIFGDKALKRSLACELLSTLLSTGRLEDAILQNLAERTRDVVVTVRCSALRAIAILAAKRPFVLLETEACLLKSAIQSTNTDEKPGVRRWAVKVLSLCPSLNEEVLEVCIQRCRDVSISVRKAAAEALGSFIQRYPNTSVEAFQRGVLPLVRDDEKTVSDAVLVILRDILFSFDQEGGLTTVYSLLYTIRSEAEVECLGTALKQIAARQDSTSLFRKFINDIANEAIVHLPNEQEANRKALWALWLVLEKCAELNCLPSPKSLTGDFLCEAWAAVRGMLTTTTGENPDEERVGACEAHALQRRILKVIRFVQHERIGTEKRLEIGNDMLQDLAALDRPPEVVNEMLSLLVALCESEGKGTNVVREWGLTLKQLCETTLTKHFTSLSTEMTTTTTQMEEDVHQLYSSAECALFLLGELALLGYDPDNNGDKVVVFATDEPVTVLIQALASPEFVLKSRGAGNLRNNLTRAVAMLTLGKLCIRDDVLAKRCVAVFVKELSENHGPGHEAVRCNALLVLGDMCRRFTNVVEPYMEKISRSLGDVAPAVRKRCLLVLAGLTQEEYVRLRPSLFFRLLACAGDMEDVAVSQAAEFVLVNGFHRRYPTLFHQNASNLLFAICGLSRLGYKPASHDESLLVDDVSSLVGVQVQFLRCFPVRQRLYELVLSRLDEAQKLEVCNKLRRDVFGGLLDGSIALDQFDLNVPENEMSAVTRVVMDTFKVLESDFANATIGLTGGVKHASVNEDGEEAVQDGSSTTEAAMQRATLKIIDALERKNLVENVVPLLVSLSSVASRERSSLAKPVVDHLKFLYERYRTECSSALAPHRDLHGLIQMELGATKLTTTQGGKEAAPLVFHPSRRAGENTEFADDNGSTFEQADSFKKKVKTPKVLRRVKAMMTRG